MKLLFTILILIAASCFTSGFAQKNIEIQREFPAYAKVKMNLESRNLNIKTWNENKIKLVINISSRDSKDKTEAQWLDSLKFEINRTTSQLEIKSRSFFDFNSFDVYSLGLEMVPGKKFITKEKDNIYYYDGYKMTPLEEAMRRKGKVLNIDLLFTKVNLTLFIPQNTEVDIVSDFGLLNVENDLNQLHLNASNLTVQTSNVKNLRATGQASTLNFNNVGKADINIEGSELYAQAIEACNITSSGSSVEIRKLNTLKINSQMDEYVIGDVDVVEGSKNYGKFGINLLNTSFNIKGQNANIRLNAISDKAKSFLLTNKFAQLSIPVKALPAYEINLEGDDLYTSGGLTFTSASNSDRNTKKAAAGDFKNALIMKINCDQCTINFQ